MKLFFLEGECDGCGYKKMFDELEAAIKASHPDVQITSKQGSIGSFEVTINDVLVHSKLRTMAFPDIENVVEVVEEVQSGMPPREIKKQSVTGCVIL